MKRLPQLDGVRGVAILLVLLFHYFYCQIAIQDPHRIVSYCIRAFSLTWSGVDLFFVLSGFLITGILLDHRSAPNYFSAFYFRRICRICPLYFIWLSIFVWLFAANISKAPDLQWVFQRPLPFWSYATFTQNFCMGAESRFGPAWLGVTWSLAIEEQFYLLFPLLIYVLPRRPLVFVLVAGILAAPILRIVSPGFHTFVGTAWRADGLFSGALLAVLVRWHPLIATVRRHRQILPFLLIGFLGGAAAMTVKAGMFGLLNHSRLGAFNHSWLAALYAIFILIAFVDTGSPLRNLLETPVLIWFGKLSYGIYIFHQAASGILHGLIRHSKPQIRTVSDAGVTVLALGATLLLASLSYYVFEKRVIRFGHRYRYTLKPHKDALLQTVPVCAQPRKGPW